MALGDFIGEIVQFAAAIALAYSGNWVAAAAMLAGGIQTHEAGRRQRAAKRRWEDSLKDVTRMVKASGEARNMILGTARVSGPILFADSFGPKKESITLAIALAGHECNAITEIYFNDKLVALDGSGNVSSGEFSKPGSIITISGGFAAGASIPIPTTISLDVVNKVLPPTYANAIGTSGGTVPANWQYSVSAYYTTSSPPSGYKPNGERVTVAVGVSGSNFIAPTNSSPANGGGTGSSIEWYVQYTYPSANVTKYLGAPGQTASASMITNFPTKWNSNRKLTGICWIEVTLRYDQDIWGQTGLPNISATVQGAKVFNYTTSVTAFSNNAASCIAHWLRHQTLGFQAQSSEIVTSEMQTAEALCNENVLIAAATNQARYTIDGFVSTETSPNETKQKFEEAIGGTIVWCEGRWLIRPGTYRTPTYTITESDVAPGGLRIVPTPSAQSFFNRVVPNYVSPTDNYAITAAPEVTSATYLTQDNNLDLPTELTFGYCQEPMRAQRLAKLFLDRNRNSTTISLACKLHVYDQVLSDTVYVTLADYGLSAVPFEVIARNLDYASKTINLTLQLTGATLYAFDYTQFGVAVSLPAFNLPSASAIPAAPTGLVATTIEPASASQVGLSVVKFTWTPHPDAFVANGGAIYIYSSAGTGRNLLGRLPGDSFSLEVYNLPWGDADIHLVAENVRGRQSPAGVFSVNLQPDTNPPATPTSFVSTIVQGGAKLTWTDPRIATGDYKESELRVGGANWAAATFVVMTNTTEHFVSWPVAGTYVYRIKHYDWSGNASGEATQSVVITATNTSVQWTNIAGSGRPADNATADLSVIASGNVTVTGNTVARTTGGGTWDAGFRSRDGYVGGAYFSYRVGAVAAVIVGLNADPAVDDNYTTIDYSVYLDNAGALHAFQNATNLQTMVASGVVVGDSIAMSYDGTNVRWYRNGVVLRTTAAVMTAPLYLDASLSAATAKVTDLRFGPLTSNAWAAIGGTGKPEDNATLGADWSTNVTGIPYSTIFNNDEATALGFNPVFADWTGTLPVGYGALVGAAPAKETTITRIGANAVRFNGCANDNRHFNRSSMFGVLPAGTWLAGSYDVYIPTWASGSPLLLVDLFKDAAGTTYQRFEVPLGASNAAVTGIWQRVPFSLRLATGQIYGVRIYLMGSWTSYPFTGDAIFDNLRFMFADAGSDTVPIADETANYRTDAAPTNNAAFGTITSVATADGNILVSVPYTYTQGALPADFLYIYAREAGGTVVASDYAVMSDPVTGTHFFTVKPSTTYSFGLQAGRRTDSGLKLTSILTSSNLAGAVNNYTGNVGGTSSTVIAAVATNFNSRNDQNGAAVVTPTITSSMVVGTKAVEHTVNADGSVDISFEWGWAGDNTDIDGFKVFIRQASAGGAYTMGSAPGQETVYTVPAEKRAMLFYGMPADKFYYFNVKAYRVVDFIINTNEIMESGFATFPVTAPVSYPYQPETSVVFTGDITGTVGGIPVGDVNQWDHISGTGKPRQFQIFAAGSSATNKPAGIASGLRDVDNAVQLSAVSRSYALTVLDRNTGDVALQEYYDLYAGQTAGNIYPANFLLRSEEFNDATWVKRATHVVTTTNALADPFGNPTAELITATAGVVNAGLYQEYTGTNQQYTCAIWLRSGTLASAFLVIKDRATDTVKLSTTVVLTATWTRFTVTATTAGASAGLRFEFGGIGSGNFYAFGAQASPGAAAVKYRATTTAVRYRSAQELADDLNEVSPLQIATVATYDEPLTNRLTAGLPEAIYRCGGSPAVFGSTNFQSRGAYCLVGIGGCGQGNGFESYAGDIASDPNSWILASFTLQNGLLNVSGQGTNPRALTDYGYVGALDATSNPIYQQASAPTGTISDGAIWIDTDDKNKTYYRSAGAWVLRRDSDIQAALDAASASQDTADGKIASFYQTTAPVSGMSVGDLWFDTDDTNKLYRYSGSTWVASTDTRIATALTNAQTAQDTADGKVTTFFTTSTPTADAIGDLWYSSTTLVLQRWNGSAWASVSTHGAPAGSLINGVAVATVTTAVTNFNASNDRDTNAVTAPALPGAGACIDHTGAGGSNTLNTDGSVDISFEWTYAGTQGSIDGFMVYVYQSTSSGSYTFGATPALETVYSVPANKLAFILFGVPADRYYTFGVRSYRAIDSSLGDNSGVVMSTILQSAFGGENPYQPSSTANVAFNGSITGTIATSAGALAAANVNVWASVTGAGKPVDNATVGAVWGTNLTGRPANLAALGGSEGIQNTLITLSAGGVLGNAGGGTLDLSQISGTIVAGQVVANSIAASKLTLTNLSNLLENPNFELGATSGWTLAGAGTSVINNPANAHAGDWVLTSTTGVSDQIVIATNNMLTAIVPGQTYHLSGFAKASGTAGTLGTVELRINWLNAAGGSVSTSSPVHSWTASTSYLQKSANYVAPATAVTARIEWVRRLQTTGTWYMDSPRFCPASSAELIVDGAVTTQHLAANTVTASKLSVVAGGGNLVPNGSFEYRPSGNQPGGYSAYNNGSATVTWMDVTGSNGTGKAFALRADSAVSNTFGLHTGSAVNSGTIYVGGVEGGWKASTTYMLSVMAKKVNGAGWTTLALGWNTAPTVVVVAAPTLGTVWQRYVWRITTGASVEAQGRVYITASPNVVAINDQICFDELSITEGDVEVAYSARVTELMPGTVQVDHLVSNMLSSDNVLTRNLTVRDASGNVLLGVGSPLDFANVGGASRPSDYATSNLTMVNKANTTITGNDVVKSSGVGNQWNASAYSRDGYVGGATVSCVVEAISANHFMMALTADPATTANPTAEYINFDYAFYMDATTTLRAFESNVNIAGLGAAAIGDVLTITYDGSFVRYYRNGAILRGPIAANITDPLHAHVCIYNTGVGVGKLQFGPYGNPSAVSPNNRINSGNATTFIDNAAINDAQIGNIIKSSNYEMYNLIKDFVTPEYTNWKTITGSGLTLVTDASSVTGAVGAITGYSAVRAAWTGTVGGGYLSTLHLVNDKKAVAVGDVVEAHAYTQCLCGTARLLVAFYDAAGSLLSTTLVSGGGGTATMGAATTTLTSVLANFAHLSGFVTAPANTASAVLVVQVARTASTTNTDLYVNIPSLAVVMDSSATVHTWPAASGLGGAGWILNKADGLEIDAANIRGRLTTDQLQVGAGTSVLLDNVYVPHSVFAGAITAANRTGVTSISAENVATTTSNTTYNLTWTAPAGAVWASLTIYNHINGPVQLYVSEASVKLSGVEKLQNPTPDSRAAATGCHWQFSEGTQDFPLTGADALEASPPFGAIYVGSEMLITKAAAGGQVVYASPLFACVAGSVYNVKVVARGNTATASGLYIRVNYRTSDPSLPIQSAVVLPDASQTFDLAVGTSAAISARVHVLMRLEATSAPAMSEAPYTVDASGLHLMMAKVGATNTLRSNSHPKTSRSVGRTATDAMDVRGGLGCLPAYRSARVVAGAWVSTVECSFNLSDSLLATDDSITAMYGQIEMYLTGNISVRNSSGVAQNLAGNHQVFAYLTAVQRKI